MDLLDSILNGMEKPPEVRKPEIKDKEKREKFEKMQKQRQEHERKQKEMMDKFRSDFSRKMRHFVDLPCTEDPKTTKLELKPMNKFYRSIVREACEDFQDDVIVHSFGEEEIDRHCVIWKKGFEPTEGEIRAMKLGVPYKPPKPEDEGDDEDKSGLGAGSSNATRSDGKDKYWSKYEKIIGKNSSGVECAKVALPAKQYGFVPIENKKDQRSIEQTLDDIRKNKKQKTCDKDEPGDN